MKATTIRLLSLLADLNVVGLIDVKIQKKLNNSVSEGSQAYNVETINTIIHHQRRQKAYCYIKSGDCFFDRLVAKVERL